MIDDLCDTLLQIERQLPVTELVVADIHVWPLVRLKVWEQMSYSRSKVSTASQSELHVGGLRQSMEACGFERVVSNDTDVLLFTSDYQHNHWVNGQRSFRPVDAVSVLRDERYLCCKLLIVTEGEGQDFWVQPDLTVPIEHLEIGVPMKESASLSLLDDINVILHEQGWAPVSKENINNFGFGIRSRVYRLRGILNKINPRVVLLSSYFSTINMALCCAARLEGIPVYDMQHGRLGPRNPMYTDFATQPEGGYTILPTGVWCWNTVTVDDIASACHAESPVMDAVCMGNPWDALPESVMLSESSRSAIQHLKVKLQSCPVILVSLQPLQEPFSDELNELMKCGAGRVFFLIRLHPRMHGEESIIEDYVSRILPSGTFDVAQSSHLPLRSVLKCSDLHVTRFSSCTVEAIEAGVVTCLIDPIGFATLGRFVDNESVYFRTNPKKVLELVIRTDRNVSAKSLNSEYRGMAVLFQNLKSGG